MKKWVALLCTLMLCGALAACGGKDESAGSGAGGEGLEVKDVAMDTIRQAVVDALGDNYFPNSTVEAEVLEGLFGVSADLYDDYYGEMPMINTNADKILVVKAKADKVADVEAALNTYLEGQKGDTMQYPQNLGKIQAAMMETYGNYVCLVMLGGDVMDLLDQGDEAVIAHCQEQNQLALDAIKGVVTQ